MALSKYEKEVVITFNEEEAFAEVYCSSPKWMKKLDEIAKASKEVEVINRSKICGEWRVPKNLVNVRKPRASKKKKGE